MLYILTALRCEASQLQRLPGEIIVTGVSQSCRNVLDGINLAKGDRIMNIGVCAANRKTAAAGDIFAAQSVLMPDDGDGAGRRFYPDIPAGILIDELPLVTVTEIEHEPREGCMYDMEAGYIAGYAFRYLPPSSFMAIKVVSDDGSSISSASQVSELIRARLPEIKRTADVFAAQDPERDYLPLDRKLTEQLRLTEYMNNELEEIEHYCVCAGRVGELYEILGKLREQGVIPCTTKAMGREVLDAVYSYLR